jgi:hypothetical protein
MDLSGVQSLNHEHRGWVANPCLDIQCELAPSPAVATHRRRQRDGVK